MGSYTNPSGGSGGGGGSTVDPTTVLLANASGVFIPAGTLVYFSGPGAFSRAGASNIVIARCQGIAIADIAIGGTGYIKVAGIVTLTTAQWDNVTGGSGGLLSANAYYVDVTPGRPTVGPPSAGGQFITLAGIAASTTQLRLMIQPPIGL
jgi:hypothetical protein